jgi:hypothetical protein
VAAKEIAVKKYIVRLSAEERVQLNDLVRKGKRSAQSLTKARIAKEARVLADQLTDREARTLMLNVVDSYDKLAERAEKKLRDAGK